jgi:fatty acid desaturase
LIELQSIWNIRDNLKASASLLISLLWSLTGLSNLFLGSAFFLPVSWVLIGVGIHGMITLMHECTHWKLFKNKITNEIVGYIIGIIILTSYARKKELDALHHSEYGNSKDPFKPRPFDKKISKIYFFIKYTRDDLGLLGNARFVNYWLIFSVQIISLLVHTVFVLYFACYIDYVLYFIVPRFFVSFVLQRFRLVCEHGGMLNTGDVMLTARTIIAPKIISFALFPHNSNFHLEHHLFSNVPHYNLKKLNEYYFFELKNHGAHITSFHLVLHQIFDYADSKCSNCDSVCPLKKPLLTAASISNKLKSS